MSFPPCFIVTRVDAGVLSYHPCDAELSYHPCDKVLSYHPCDAVFSYHPCDTVVLYYRPCDTVLYYHPCDTVLYYHPCDTVLSYHPCDTVLSYHPCYTGMEWFRESAPISAVFGSSRGGLALVLAIGCVQRYSIDERDNFSEVFLVSGYFMCFNLRFCSEDHSYRKAFQFFSSFRFSWGFFPNK